MPKTILRDVTVSIDGVDLSDHVSSVSVNSEKDDVDLTAFGDDLHVHGVGLGDGSIEMDVYQDFGAGSVHVTPSAIYTAGEAVPIIVKPTAAAISATNPAITMDGLLMSYSPLAGSVGEASTMSVTFQNGGSTGIVYDITP